MNLEIITPDKKLFSGVVNEIQFPGSDGSFGVWNNHAPLIATLKKGIIKVTTDKHNEESYDINGGVVEILKNNVIVLAE
jgi:F-type H+-transporting ATPase subunit epsilon